MEKKKKTIVKHKAFRELPFQAVKNIMDIPSRTANTLQLVTNPSEILSPRPTEDLIHCCCSILYWSRIPFHNRGNESLLVAQTTTHKHLHLYKNC